jgi:Tfp pilus assembly protein PilX
MSMRNADARPDSSGVVLIATLFLMFVVTLTALGVVLLKGPQSQATVAAIDSELAYQTAEAILTEAVTAVRTQGAEQRTPAMPRRGWYDLEAQVAQRWRAVDWSNDDSVVRAAFKSSPRVTGAYIVERLPVVIAPGHDFDMPAMTVRITARASVNGTRTSSMLQSVILLN